MPKVDLAFPKPKVMRHQPAKREAVTIEEAREEIENGFKEVMDAILHDLHLKAHVERVETDFLPIDVLKDCAEDTPFNYSKGLIYCGAAPFMIQGEIVIKLDTLINKAIFEDAFDAV
ncbi:unnamed protein product, partial [Mesorhabditis belari]|uniref:Uncharacterized protein n=1 Tax=Mesorhabditis belari TaxID=2138241 RepID=A0AAF3FMQ0_9BILA